MRIWSIHPKYLDTKGLGGLWLESIIAKNTLQGTSFHYRNHPQLERFKKSPQPLDAINQYLSFVYTEAENRHFKFNKSYFRKPAEFIYLTVTRGQLIYEFNHLLGKLKTRDPELYYKLAGTETIDANPMFKVVPGEAESWEKIKKP